MSQLIAVIDGSSYSQSVCDHTAWIAERSGGSVAVVHVLGRRDVASDTSDLSGSIGLGARSELLEELAELDGQKARLAQKRGRAILDGAKGRLEAAGVSDVATRLRHGEVVETVREFEEEARLIIIGKRGEAANFSSGHLGSNLERVVRSTQKLVLVASREFKPIERALVAFDGGPSVLKAIDYIARSKTFRGIQCHLLSVGNATSERRRDLEGAVAVLQDAGYEATSECLAGQPETAIASKVDSDHYDLLVMGAYGHSRIRNMIIGSTTTQMLVSCKIPVLLFR